MIFNKINNAWYNFLTQHTSKLKPIITVTSCWCKEYPKQNKRRMNLQSTSQRISSNSQIPVLIVWIVWSVISCTCKMSIYCTIIRENLELIIYWHWHWHWIRFILTSTKKINNKKLITLYQDINKYTLCWVTETIQKHPIMSI